VAVSPSISGIITSISTRSGFASRTAFSASRPFLAIRTRAPLGSKTLVSANTLRTSSSTMRIERPSKTVSRSRAARSIRWLSGGSRDST
jgi:hypothetical protein